MPTTIAGPRGLASLITTEKASPFAGIASLPKTAAPLSLAGKPGLASLNQSLFNLRVEKHIDDVKRGEAGRSSEIGAALAEKDQEISATLAATNPEAASQYSAYSTVLGYDKRARLISSLDLTTRSLQEIPSEEESKARVDEIVKAFYPDRERS